MRPVSDDGSYNKSLTFETCFFTRTWNPNFPTNIAIDASVQHPQTLSTKAFFVQRKIKRFPKYLMSWYLFQEENKRESPFKMNLTEHTCQPETGNTMTQQLIALKKRKRHRYFAYLPSNMNRPGHQGKPGLKKHYIEEDISISIFF